MEANTKTIIIEQPWGGLGDNLQFSTLPKLFADRGTPVYLSSRNVTRNPEIHELVWGRNPHVIGIADGEPSAGACMSPSFDGPAISRHLSLIRRIEQAHGFEPTNDFPKIYYRPKLIPALSNAVLLDLGSTSVAAPVEHLRAYVRHVFSHYLYSRDDAYQVRFSTRVATQNTFPINDLRPWNVESIFSYCDALYSCRVLITVHSGAQTLAAAVRGDGDRPLIHCFATPQQFNWRNYIFPRIEYFVL